MKIIGYGYKLSNETVDEAIRIYGGFDCLSKSKRVVIAEIKKDKGETISKQSKPKIFKVVIEYI